MVITGTEKDVIGPKETWKQELAPNRFETKNYVPALPRKQDDSPLTNISCFRRRPRPGLLRGLCILKLLYLPGLRKPF